jgi:hypothetical protein
MVRVELSHLICLPPDNSCKRNQSPVYRIRLRNARCFIVAHSYFYPTILNLQAFFARQSALAERDTNATPVLLQFEPLLRSQAVFGPAPVSEKKATPDNSWLTASADSAK